MTVATVERPSLATVIASSPVRSIGIEVHVFHYDSPPDAVDGDFAVIFDGLEATVVSFAPERLREAAESGRGTEGPFAGIRLEISDSFGADGFIATATTACARAGVGSYLLSTFSYDYLFVAPERLDDALAALQSAGFPVAR